MWRKPTKTKPRRTCDIIQAQKILQEQVYTKCMKIFRYLILGLAVVAIAITTLEIVKVKKFATISKILIARTLPYEQKLKQPTLRILIIGDSTGIGIGSNSPSDSIAGRLGNIFPEAEITNFSTSGDRIHDGLQSITQIKESYDILMVMLGGNDALHFTNLQNLTDDTNTILEESKKRSRAVILMPAGNLGSAPMIPQAVRWLFERRSKKVRDVLSKQAQENAVIFVDLLHERTNDPFAQKPQKFYAPDGLHPSSAGYALWFK
ncbi:MAG: hypothetical protein A3E60_04150, partial [Candidatus Kerfeldbacteria bacterium RIFCSPHIGHO2_12_FULL_42_13]